MAQHCRTDPGERSKRFYNVGLLVFLLHIKPLALGFAFQLSMLNGCQCGLSLRRKRNYWSGGTGFLAYLMNKPKDQVQVEDIEVIWEYADVFPEELEELPPEREVEFTIDLVHGA